MAVDRLHLWPRRRPPIHLGRSAFKLSVLLAIAIFAGCADPPHFRKPLDLGGKLVPASVLETGRRNYDRYCRNCHGVRGDGDGPIGWKQKPRPRDFTKGIFKYAAVRGGELPNDSDLLRITKRGLKGTGMLPWDIADDEIVPILHYIKTFSPRWRETKAGEPIEPTPDPWLAREPEAIERGKLVYRGLARCWSCHPAYASPNDLRAASVEIRGTADLPFRERLDQPVVTESAYGPIKAPDFSRSNLRAGSRPEDLYRTIACGIGGTSMPTWKGAIDESDLWALAHYVRSLVGDLTP